MTFNQAMRLVPGHGGGAGDQERTEGSHGQKKIIPFSLSNVLKEREFF